MSLPDTLHPALTFRHLVVLYPVATAFHVLEEWPRFPCWARRFASPQYSDREYVITHVIAVFSAVAAAALVRTFTAPWVVFAFFALVLGPSVFCNALFHAAASIGSRAYCPGTVTGLALYVPLSAALATLALREGLIVSSALLAALFLAAVFHALEVGHNVFKRW